MEAQNTSAAASLEQFQGKGTSGLMAFIQRIATLSPVISRLRAFTVTSGVIQERLPNGKPGSGSRLTGRTRPDPYALPGESVSHPVLSLRKAVDELERLWRVRRSNLTVGDLQYAMEVQLSLMSILKDELEQCGSMAGVAGYRDIHSSQPAALLEVLLEIYCDALSRSQAEWCAEAGDADAVVVCLAEAASLLVKFSWVCSEEPLPIVWRAFTAAYRKIRIQTGDLADGFSDRKSDFVAETLRATISRALLLSLADPFSMQSSEIIAADRLIASHLSGIDLGDCWSHDAVAFDLEGGIPLSGRKADIASRKCVVWISVKQIVASVLDQSAKGEVERTPDLQPGVMQDMSHILARRWMAFPSHRQNVRTEAFIGSRVVCGAVSLIQAEKPGSGVGYDKRAHHIGRDCVVLDYSEGGCRARLRGAGYLNLSPGILVGIELPSVQGRSVGVISWTRRVAEAHAEVGIRLLAREVEPVPLKLLTGRWEGGSLVEFGLLSIGESGQLHRENVEILLPSSKAPAGELKILRDVNTGTDFHVREVLEVGRDFLRVRACTALGEAPVKMEFEPFSI